MKPKQRSDDDRTRDVLQSVATEHLLTRLRDAARLADKDLESQHAQILRLIDEARDQIEAWRVSRDSPADPRSGATHEHMQNEQHVSLLERVAFDRAGGDPVREFLLVPFGEVDVERPIAGGSFVFTHEHAQAATEWFTRMGRKLAIDYEHQSLARCNTRPDGLRPAAGWIGRLETRHDGLWACDVSWTPRAGELLRSGEYRYFSPVIYWSDRDFSELVGLGPVALTNDPAMRGVLPLAGGRETNIDRPLSRTVSAQTDEEDDPDEPRTESPEAAVDPESEEVGAELTAARERIDILQRELKRQEADTFVERGMRLGKILDSTSMDWRDDYLRDAEDAEARLSRAPVILPQGVFVRKDAPVGRTVGGDARQRELFERWGIEPQDLDAYERASAAGRVHRFGVVAQV